MVEDIISLIQRVRAGERTAGDAFIEQYKRLVKGILGKFDNLTPPERDDLFQDVFLTLLDGGLQRFRGATGHELRAYLARITTNTAYTYIRDRGRHEKIEIPYASFATEEEHE